MSFYLPPAIHLLFRSFLVRRPQYLMLFPWQNCSFSTLKRSAGRMAGLLGAGDHILRRIDTAYYSTAGFHGQEGSSWPQQHRGNERALYQVQPHCREGSLGATESCVPALVLSRTPVSLTWPLQWPLSALFSLCQVGSLSCRQVQLPSPQLTSHFPREGGDRARPGAFRLKARSALTVEARSETPWLDWKLTDIWKNYYFFLK